MTTIAAVYEPATASVVLTVTPTSAVTQVIRSDANGAGIAVRHLPAELPTAAPFVWRDYEAAHGEVTYAALDAGTGATAAVTVTLAGPRLAAVLQPAALALPDLVTGYTAGRAPMTTVHEVIGRPDAVPTLGKLRSRRGVLEILTADYDTARAVTSVYDQADTVLLRQADYAGLDLYHVPEGPIEERPAGAGRRWLVTVPYREVGRPLDDLGGVLGWTWDDVLATYGTWAEVEQAYSSWIDLQEGPTA